MAPKLSSEERANIVALLKEGKSQGAVAREVGRSQKAVWSVARDEGIVGVVNSVTKKANAARKAYAEERRLELVGKGFDKADELLKTIVDAGEFQKWTVGLGTLVDKARLETGEATERKENVDPSRRERIRQSLDEVGAKRRERMG